MLTGSPVCSVRFVLGDELNLLVLSQVEACDINSLGRI